MNLSTHPYLRKLAPLVGLLFLLVGLGTTLSLVRQRQQIAIPASANLVDLSLSAPTYVNPGQEVIVAVTINTQSYKVTAVNLNLAFPADKFDFVSLVPADFLSTVLSPPSPGTGNVTIILGSGTVPKQGAGVLANLMLRAKADAAGTAQITIDPATQVAGIDSGGNSVPTSILGDANPTTIAITPATSTPTPTPTPSAQNLISNGSFENDSDSDGIPNKWSLRLGGPDNKSMDNNVRTGNRSFRFSGVLGKKEILVQEIESFPKSKLYFSGYVRGSKIIFGGPKSAVRMQVLTINNNGQYHAFRSSINVIPGNQSGKQDEGFGWTVLGGALSINANVKRLFVVLKVQDVEGKIFFDDIRLAQQPQSDQPQENLLEEDADPDETGLIQ